MLRRTRTIAFPLPVTLAICALLLTPIVMRVSAHGLKLSAPLAPSPWRKSVVSIIESTGKSKTQANGLQLRTEPGVDSLAPNLRGIPSSSNKFAASDFSSGNIFVADSVARLYGYFLNHGVF